jgi:ribosome biogenesis GTPase
MLPNGGLLIDTPGMRELGLQADTTLDDTFAEVLELLTQCRFSNCTHIGEPGCAIISALETQALTEERWAAYQKLAREQQAMAANISPDSRRVKLAKTKKMTRELRQIYRDKYE